MIPTHRYEVMATAGTACGCRPASGIGAAPVGVLDVCPKPTTNKQERSQGKMRPKWVMPIRRRNAINSRHRIVVQVGLLVICSTIMGARLRTYAGGEPSPNQKCTTSHGGCGIQTDPNCIQCQNAFGIWLCGGGETAGKCVNLTAYQQLAYATCDDWSPPPPDPCPNSTFVCQQYRTCDKIIDPDAPHGFRCEFSTPKDSQTTTGCYGTAPQS